MKFQNNLLFLILFIYSVAPIGVWAQESTSIKKVILAKPKKVVPSKAKTLVLIVQPRTDLGTATPIKDSSALAMATIKDSFVSLYTSDAGATTEDNFLITKQVDFSQSDYLFYILVAMFLLLASVRAAFPKYFNDLFGLFSQSTFKQKSIREQLSQSAVPSFLLNILFFFSASFFLYLITGYYQMHVAHTFEGNFGIWIMVLIAVYISKMMVIKLLGWVFQMQETCQVYNFIVFMMNKVIGVLLLPILLLLCFGPVTWRPSVVIVAFFFIACMFLYRYIIAYPSLRPTVRLNRFHFFIYLCTFEILPLALIYKEITVQFLQTT